MDFNQFMTNLGNQWKTPEGQASLAVISGQYTPIDAMNLANQAAAQRAQAESANYSVQRRKAQDAALSELSTAQPSEELAAQLMRIEPRLGLEMHDMLRKQKQQEQLNDFIMSSGVLGGQQGQVGNVEGGQSGDIGGVDPNRLAAAGLVSGNPSLIQFSAMLNNQQQRKDDLALRKEGLGIQNERLKLEQERVRQQQDIEERKRTQPAPQAGYRYNQSGQLEVIPGTPADAESKKRTKQSQALIDEGIAESIRVDELLSHKGFESAVGSKIFEPDYLLGFKDEPLEGSPSADFSSRQKQLKGSALLQAMSVMSGTGAISNTEGEAGAAALNRMSQATSEKEYQAAAKDYKTTLLRGVANTIAQKYGADSIDGLSKDSLRSMSVKELDAIRRYKTLEGK